MKKTYQEMLTECQSLAIGESVEYREMGGKERLKELIKLVRELAENDIRVNVAEWGSTRTITRISSRDAMIDWTDEKGFFAQKGRNLITGVAGNNTWSNRDSNMGNYRILAV